MATAAAAAAVSSLVTALRECSRLRDLERGTRVHCEAEERGLSSNRYVVSSLINMYAKCGRISEAHKVFNSLIHPDVTCWTALILGYASNGQPESALQLFDAMEMKQSLKPDARTYVAAVRACTSLERGKEIHSRAVTTRCCDVFVENALISMYARCSSMSDARRVFDEMVLPDVVSWTCLLQGYVDNQEPESGLRVFQAMANAGCVPNERTFVAAISACAALATDSSTRLKKSSIEKKGKLLHSQALMNSSCCANVFVKNTLIDMYARCGNMVEAHKVFDEMSSSISPDVVSWTVLLQGYVDNGCPEVALGLFDSYNSTTLLLPDAKIFVAAITACASLAQASSKKFDKLRSLRKGKSIHRQVLLSSPCCCDILVLNTLVDMYGKCGSLVDARNVFDSLNHPTLVSWTLLLQVYVDSGQCKAALQLFDAMTSSSTTSSPDSRAFVVGLSACAALGWLERGKKLHSQAATNNAISKSAFVQSALVDMYAKCGSMVEARNVFDGMFQCDVVSWTALITGYVSCGENSIALRLSAVMDVNGVAFNSLTFLAAIAACGNLMSVQIGKDLHADVVHNGLLQDVSVANCLVDFYGKCGRMKVAKQIFDSIAKKTSVSWTCLMCGYSLQGKFRDVIQLFDRMREQGVTPDEVTFVCLLAACSHGGLTEQGIEYFKVMKSEYGISPNVNHYTCVADLLCRAQYPHEAFKLVSKMPFQPTAITWTALLEGSNDRVSGRLAFESLMKINRNDPGAYILLASKPFISA